MLPFSRLDTLPRSAKTAILVVSDALMAAVAIWFAVLLRAGSRGQGTVVAIYGAGAAGQQLAAMLRRAAEYHPVVYLDDAQGLRGRMVEGLPVLSPSDAKLVDRLQSKGVQQIYLAIPSLKASRRRGILDSLGTLPFHVRSVRRLTCPTELANMKSVN